MGVNGLLKMLEGNSDVYQVIQFSNSELVVDGCNLAYYLYNMAELDQNHGGEYLAFQAEVQAFFKTLDNCRIKAYVVIDGGLGTSDIQLKTRMSRQSALLQNIPAALTGEKKGIYPPFVMSVFEQTLNDLRVPQVKCFGEADGRLAALAKECSCPVLSEDTDFYIYDLPEGVLPLVPFWQSVKDSPASSEIRCKLYTTTKFCTAFNIDHQLLPIFASLVKLRDVRWAQFLPRGSPKMKFSTANLVGILSWLRARTDRTTEDTLKAATALIPDMIQDAQAEVKNMLRESMLEYELPSSPAPLLIGFLSKGTVPQLPAKLSSVPEWVRASLAMGGMGANILQYDILLHRRKILRIQVERKELNSSFLISRPIRQVLYGLLLGQEGGEVEEVDRVGLDPVNVKVKPAVEHQKLMLDSLPQADPAVRLQVCLETLGVEEETLEGVPAHLRLPVAVTRYWLRRASPEPTLLKALLMVMVQGELNRRKGGTTGWQGVTSHHPQPLDGVVAHSFNQWQASLTDASQLNLLLLTPHPRPSGFGGSQAQLRASMEHLHLNTQKEEEEEEEEELGGAAGLDQVSDGSRVEVKSRRRKQ
ncbi:protein asteroid homolog 1-like isoform X5 [Gadus macrocephalus]|uniref:protein asteroid homolog 1-like isoform X5 n=1 Tax=Gadus macrocephalus TaxID=80720 RepID=UPI0028CB9EA2|nr:protein asteroid homolog 1-like isoform X5 [Gadus macrocephalus]